MYIVISDTHIGDKHSNKNLQTLFSLLNSFDENSTLILNGDILDLSKHLCFDERHRIFFRLIQKFKKIIYLEGNHDWFLSGLKNIFPKIEFRNNLILTINNKIIKIFHGHQLDFLIKYFPRIVRALVIINCWFYKLIGVDFQHLFYKYIQRLFFGLRERKFTRLEMEANIIITGHTHFPNKRTINNVEYYNTGDWIESSHVSYVVIHDDGNVELKKLRG